MSKKPAKIIEVSVKKTLTKLRRIPMATTFTTTHTHSGSVPTAVDISAVRSVTANALAEAFNKKKSGTTVTTPKDDEYQERLKAFTLDEGKQSFRRLLNVPKSEKLPSGSRLVDHNITVFKDSDYSEEIRLFIPEVDADYRPDIVAAERILVGWERGEKILSTGPTGCGKSELFKHLCAITRRPFFRVNGSGDIETAHLLGTTEVEAGATKWVDGVVPQAISTPNAVLLLDEYDIIPADVMLILQWLLERNGKLFLKEKPGTLADKQLMPLPSVRIALTGNTLGLGERMDEFAGTQVQNTATLDRVDTVVKMNYMDPASEKAMLQDAHPSINSVTISKCVDFANLVRQAYQNRSVQLTMSTRTLRNWLGKVSYWDDELYALRICWLDKLPQEDQAALSDTVYRVFGKKTI